VNDVRRFRESSPQRSTASLLRSTVPSSEFRRGVGAGHPSVENVFAPWMEISKSTQLGLFNLAARRPLQLSLPPPRNKAEIRHWRFSYNVKRHLVIYMGSFVLFDRMSLIPAVQLLIILICLRPGNNIRLKTLWKYADDTKRKYWSGCWSSNLQHDLFD